MDHTLSSYRQRRSHGICAECRRQKQRCDRQSPCANCSRRGMAHLCQAAAQRLTPAGSHTPLPPSLPLPPPPPPQTAPRLSPSSSASSPQPTLGGRPRVGHIWNSRGGPSYHSESYFGPQAVADVAFPAMASSSAFTSSSAISAFPVPTLAGSSGFSALSTELPALSLAGVHLTSDAYRRNASNSHHGALSLHAHIWELLGHIPRPRAVVDGMVQRFFAELNEVFDGLHQETFLSHYEAFWARRWGDDDLLTVDLRWLALLFMVLAFSELLLLDDGRLHAAAEHEETSLQFFWASRKCLVIAPTFSGESPDLVRAGILITRYLVFAGRKAEAWLTNSFAVRMAQAQGMHIDGDNDNWRLPREVSDTRRRLWATLYTLDRTLAVAVGRPYVIHDKHCMWGEPGPSPTDFFSLQHQLSALLGQIQDECFGFQAPASTTYQAYENVLRLDAQLMAWADALPAAFRLPDSPGTLSEKPEEQGKDHGSWQRLYLHAQFHFARITLHRTYVVRDLDASAASATDRFRFSREVCVASACAELQRKLSGEEGAGRRQHGMADRLKASIAAHHLFNSALVLGIVAVRSPLAPATGPMINDLQAYCEKLRADRWTNDYVLAEVKVLELCLASAHKARREAMGDRRGEPEEGQEERQEQEGEEQGGQEQEGQEEHSEMDQDLPESRNYHWLDYWLGPTGFPEPVDFRLWEDLVGNLENRT